MNTRKEDRVYRGTTAMALGQQLLDIKAITQAGSADITKSELRAARSRIEQCQNRERALRETRAAASGGLSIATSSAGGFLMQTESAVELVVNGFNNSEILPRTAPRTLDAGIQSLSIYGIDEESRLTGARTGGIRIYTAKELEEITTSKAVFREVRLVPSKLVGLAYASGEISRNVTAFGAEMLQLFGEEIAFKCQDLCIHGTGANEPLGILKAGCLITVPKEGGQVKETILAANISKMWKHYAGRRDSAVWMVNRNTTEQLDALVVGSDNTSPRFITYDAQGVMRIKGAPVVEVEQCETLGTVGDIILADWSQYVTANKGGIDEAVSIHVNFINDQDVYRFIYYFDGQPRWSSPLTPYKGKDRVSPFVVLATRR